MASSQADSKKDKNMTTSKDYRLVDGSQAKELNRVAKQFIQLDKTVKEYQVQIKDMSNKIKDMLNANALDMTSVFQTTQVEVLLQITPEKSNAFNEAYLKEHYPTIYAECCNKTKNKIVTLKEVAKL